MDPICPPWSSPAVPAAFYRHYCAERCQEDGESEDCPYCEQEAAND